MAETLTIATLNLLADRRSWPRRAPLVRDELARLRPDLVCLQEVDRGQDNARWLADALDYAWVEAPLAGWRRGYLALAVLSRLPILGQGVLPLGAQGRVALRLDVDAGGGPLRVVSAHLVWSPVDRERRRQVDRLLAWLPPDRPTLVAGDLNAPPEFASIRRLAARFASAHAAAHGTEPAWTYPTPLGPNTLAQALATPLVRRAAGLWLWRRNAPWRGTLDYLFVDRRLPVLACDLAFDRPAGHDPGLYASDHVGLVARVGLGAGAGSGGELG